MIQVEADYETGSSSCVTGGSPIISASRNLGTLTEEPATEPTSREREASLSPNVQSGTSISTPSNPCILTAEPATEPISREREDSLSPILQPQLPWLDPQLEDRTRKDRESAPEPELGSISKTEQGISFGTQSRTVDHEMVSNQEAETFVDDQPTMASELRTVHSGDDVM